MQIHESAEDYLEAILKLEERQGQVRSIDIAAELNVSKPSVSIAMKKLRESGYLEMLGNGSLVLLAPGRAIAEQIYGRHRVLTHFLLSLGISEENAAADACRIEHDLSEESFGRLKAYIEANF